MIFSLSPFAYFVVLSSAVLVFFSASISAADPDLGKTSVQQRALGDNQGQIIADFSSPRNYTWYEEDDLIGMNETDIIGLTNSNYSSLSSEEEGDFNPTGLRGGTTSTTSIQSFENFGKDGNTMLLQVSSNMQRMLNLINNERRSRGIGTLCFNYKLNQAAQDHSNDMSFGVFFGHTGSDGSSPWTRMDRRGYSRGSRGENVATNKSIDDAHSRLMNSQGHRENILNSKFTHIGIGITTYTSGKYRGNYAITQAFGNSSSEKCISSGGGGGGPDNSISSGVYFIKSVPWNTYLRLHPNGEVDMAGNPLPWEKMYVEKRGGNKYSIKSQEHGNMYVRVDGPGEGKLVNTQTYVGPWEEFYIEMLDNGRVAFRSAAHNNYLRAWGPSPGSNVDTQTFIGAWEQFTLIKAR